jgi:hypothetical protein
LIERFHVDLHHLPIVLCPNGTLLRNPGENDLARCIGLVRPIDATMKPQLTRYQMEQSALALGARLKTVRQWRQRGWPANWLLKLQEDFGEPFDIVEIWTEQDHKRWLEGLDRARSQNVADVYQAESERLKAENVELRRRLSDQQVTILNLQEELGEDAVRKIAVDKALALTRQAAVERAQFFVQQLQRHLQRCVMAQAQMAKLLHIRPRLTPCGEKLVSSWCPPIIFRSMAR